RSTLEDLTGLLSTPPDDFEPHPKLLRVLDARRVAMEKDAIDWGLAEAFAFGTLIREGTSIRLAGEDVNRGTFSHRHAEFVDHRDGRKWSPLKGLETPDVRVRMHDSLLSEFAALGFEYGYSVESPETLTIWEAQFGDFANGAQVIIDQFIAAGEDKWSQRSGVVMLLPHGFEGQGPEHSSARIERYLELCAENNLRVSVPSTAASYFHLLRRQALIAHRKPLIVFTPKSLLRTAPSFATVDDLTKGTFSRVLDDPRGTTGARRVVLCAGKVFYDLLPEAPEDVAVVRIELFYPFPEQALADTLERHPGAEVVWCQEEPHNMGAAPWIQPRLEAAVGRHVEVVSRVASASPATGSNARHHREQATLVARALGR
ncbi:MAG: multifunctional oxoglutarate decarboxylase/oxoglutarate dehydrogenase thiamine pyrophosphate-binding subunit/dihydrolipoyllysine-residue succinyltransferase subunit, partial [Acidimicrobiia bacterium]|nr:multifunctional oxoglutarate decarboxylase/oxoglutarate dehydrogenase thiamine pyrophosphate-binding subunit/dihydrolipoyllysine-residue succinyltransferase subunit [Acidimicrobiia bacterium]